MTSLSSIRRGVRRVLRLPLGGAARASRDADEEIASYLQARVDDLISQGMTPDVARAAAWDRFMADANAAHHIRHSAVHRERRLVMLDRLDTIRQDLAYAARQLRRAPLFTAVATLSLAIGIGANAAMFSVIDAVLLRRLPVPHPEELVAIGKTTAINGHTNGAVRGDLLSFPQYQALARTSSDLVTGLAASGTAERLDVRIGGGNDIEHPAGRFVSGNYFDVLGVRAQLGRSFGASEDGSIGASPVAVISDAYWRRRFAGDSSAIGQRITVDATTVTVVGVAAPGFFGDIVEMPVDLWLPITIEPIARPHGSDITSAATSWLLLLGRLAPGVTLAHARAGFTTRIRAGMLAMATSPGGARRAERAPVVVTDGSQGFSAVRRSFEGMLITLEAGVALILLMVCVNIGNLLLARAVTRTGEMSIRLSLGAGRARLVRQLLTESALLAAIGAALGLAFAVWASRALALGAAPGATPIASTSLDRRTLGVAVGVTVLSIIGFGLAPAIRATRANLAMAMRGAGRSLVASGGGRVPIGRLLIPAQVVLSVIILAGATLLARSLWDLQHVDTGLDQGHLIVAELDVGKAGIKGDAFSALTTALSSTLGGLPGVSAVTYSQNGLFIGNDADALATIPGFVGRTEQDSTVPYDLVGAGYLRAIGAHLLRGRELDDTDLPKGPSVAVVNEAFQRFYFHGASAVGHTIYFDASPTTIVGVVADVRNNRLSGTVDRRAYVPYVQQLGDDDRPSLILEIRTAGDPAAMLRTVERTIAHTAPDVAIGTLRPLSQLMNQSMAEQRLTVVLAIAFGLTALALATLGLYGVMSYAAARRSAEMGVRTALGATPRQIIRLIVGDGLRLVAVGLVIGVPAAALASRALRSRMQGLGASDSLSLGLSVSVLFACGIAACLVPAFRASRVAPTAAFRQ